jgi:NADH-quinone oxidoreductase subunit J
VTVPLFLFYLFAVFAVLSALAMVANVRNTVAAAMSLVVTMVALAVIYVLLEAHLVAAIQIMVYGGAIVVLFLFVVMLLNLRSDDFPPGRQRLLKLAGALLGIFAMVEHCRRRRRCPRASAAIARWASRSTPTTSCSSRWRHSCSRPRSWAR